MRSLKSFYITAGQHPIKSAIVITLLAALGLYINNQLNTLDITPETNANLPAVTLTTAQTYQGGDSISLLGNVRAFTEAAVTTERAGRVVRVNVTLGQVVSAGQILATLDNAAESAAVVQAEGTYEAAVAARAQAQAADAQTDVGVDDSQNAILSAQNTVVASLQSAFNTVNSAIYNSIDTFFSAPLTSVPGLRLDGKGYTAILNSERIAYQSILSTWQSKNNTLSVNSNLAAELEYASVQVERTIRLVETFQRVIEQQTNSKRYSDTELQTFGGNFSALRASLINTKSSLDAAEVGLKNAQNASTRADINTSVSAVPAADAQVKQALGSLRSAQANYAKTILRTPISGTVNSLNIKQGDFVNSFIKVAEVANNNALEIVTFVGDKEQALLSVGDVVYIEGEYEGRVTQIAPALDSATRKTEVRIATENTNIKNGDTVTITKEVAAQTDSSVIIPLTAVKFEITDGYIFDVVDGKLVQKPVVLGTVRSGSVEITQGLSNTDTFVLDARGLLPDTEVTVAN